MAHSSGRFLTIKIRKNRQLTQKANIIRQALLCFRHASDPQISHSQITRARTDPPARTRPHRGWISIVVAHNRRFYRELIPGSRYRCTRSGNLTHASTSSCTWPALETRLGHGFMHCSRSKHWARVESIFFLKQNTPAYLAQHGLIHVSKYYLGHFRKKPILAKPGFFRFPFIAMGNIFICVLRHERLLVRWLTDACL